MIDDDRSGRLSALIQRQKQKHFINRYEIKHNPIK